MFVMPQAYTTRSLPHGNQVKVLALIGVCFVLHPVKTPWFKSLRALRKEDCH